MNQLDRQPPLNPIADSPGKKKLTITSSYLRKLQRRVAWANTLIPLIGTVVAVASLWVSNITTVAVVLLVSMYALTTIGIEVGFHRYFSHSAFKANPAVRVMLAIFGSMAAQGPVIYWVSNHHRHHQYTDRPGDPHSPHLHAEKKFARLRGLWYAHLGWIFESEMSNPSLYTKDLMRDPTIAKINQFYLLWIILGLAIPAVIAGLATQTWIGAMQGFLWGGLARIFLCNQITYCVNSISHVYGNRPFESNDCSANNVWLALPTAGSTWHNNHHAFPYTAINSFEWWQIDLGGWVIRILEFCGLVSDVRMPTPEAIAAKKKKQPS
ncbi:MULTISPECIES: acyl-CoA desaturase [unclassified Microcoleus]|uniref:acyl-CoA desaturase n=1 Tax=unclassified Microcoleus TaxID=2642155 RepID=UPI002FD75D0B